MSKSVRIEEIFLDDPRIPLDVAFVAKLSLSYVHASTWGGACVVVEVNCPWSSHLADMFLNNGFRKSSFDPPQAEWADYLQTWLWSDARYWSEAFGCHFPDSKRYADLY